MNGLYYDSANFFDNWRRVYKWAYTYILSHCTLASGIDAGQGINVGPGKVGKKNKRRALNMHVLCST